MKEELCKREKKNNLNVRDRAAFILSVFLDLGGDWGGLRDEAVRHTSDYLHLAA